MTFLFFLTLIGLGLLIYQDKNEWVEIYSTFESNVGEAQSIYHCLKAHGIHCSYHILPNKRNFSFTFNDYQQATVSIKVRCKEERLAKENLLNYRVLSRQRLHRFS